GRRTRESPLPVEVQAARLVRLTAVRSAQLLTVLPLAEAVPVLRVTARPARPAEASRSAGARMRRPLRRDARPPQPDRERDVRDGDRRIRAGVPATARCVDRALRAPDRAAPRRRAPPGSGGASRR